MMKHHPHPGEILRETVFVPVGLGVAEAAERLDRPALSRVLNGPGRVTPTQLYDLNAQG